MGLVYYSNTTGQTTFEKLKWGEEVEQKPAKKMFLEIVKQLRELIAEQNILPGEKLPSERVLSEKLNVGRSSVREALRSLELLGLIESKHGGGTYLGVVQQHKLVEIVGSFILQEPKSIEDVHRTRVMHEKEAIRLVCSQRELRALPIWESLFVNIELNEIVLRENILRELIIVSGNRLALKIWLQLIAYSNTSLHNEISEFEKHAVQTLLKSMQMGYCTEALEAYGQWMEILQSY